MKKTRIGHTPFEVTRIAYGCMMIGGGWGTGSISDDTKKAGLASVRTALDQGIDFIDHADIYGRGRSEEVFSQIWSERPSLRQKLVLQTKCGIRFPDDPLPGLPGRYDYSFEHIIESVDGSLKRLRTDWIDILLLHRPDALVEPDEVARAFEKLQSTGKVRFFGVSNHSAWQIELLHKSIAQPLVVNQLEINLLHSGLIAAGVSVNQDFPPSPIHAEGTLEYCRLHDIKIQAWSPLAQGALGEGATGQSERTRKAAEIVGAMAKAKGVSREGLLIAWLLRHPAGIQPVLGTTQAARIAAACKGDEIELSREEWYTLFAAGRGSPVA